MKRTSLGAGVVVLLALTFSHTIRRMLADYTDAQALVLIIAYTAFFVLLKYSPGRCMYRVLVLHEPARHYLREVQKARNFAGYVQTRVLFAGLIFTLLQVAIVLSGNPDIFTMSAALVTTLNASLYSLVLYLAVSRVSSPAWARERN